MPVQTRSQSKKRVARTIVVPRNLIQTRSKTRLQSAALQDIKSQIFKIELQEWFIGHIKKMLNEHQALKGKENKMRTAHEIMYIVSEYFPDILRNNVDKWVRFAKVIYNKSYEFEYDSDYTGIDEDKANNFKSFNYEIRAKLLELFKELNIKVEFKNKDLHMDTGMIDLQPPLRLYP